MWTPWSSALLASSLKMEGGTARRRMAPFVRPSPPPSTCSKVCWRTSGQEVELMNRLRLGVAEKNILSSESTGGVGNPQWLQFSFPIRWHYDVLRALE